MRESKSHKYCRDPCSKQHPWTRQQQRRREQPPNDVPLESKGPSEKQNRQKAGEEEVRVDSFPEPRARRQQGPLGGEGLEGDSQEDAPDLVKE